MKNIKPYVFAALFVASFYIVESIAKNEKNIPEPSWERSIQTQINDYLEKYKSNDVNKSGEYISGIQVSVLKDDKIKTFVAGNTQHFGGSPVEAKSLFAWGSVTKEFTAAVILKLQEKKLLDLNQTLAYWFPDNFTNTNNEKSIWPQSWKRVTIAQLLNMTSGIPNFYFADFLNKNDLFVKNWQPDELVSRAALFARSSKCDQEKGCFKPGESYSYSNTNYVIAGMIASKAASIPFEIQMRSLLNESELHAYYYPHIKPAEYLNGKITNGYVFDQPAYGNLPMKNVPMGFETTNTFQLSTGPDGAIIGNTENMLTAIYKLFNQGMISKSSTELLKNKYYVREKDGALVSNLSQCTSQCFGLGVSVVNTEDLGPVWTYEGEVAGFRSYYIWVPNIKAMVTVSLNSSTSSFGGNTDNISMLGQNILISSISASKGLGK